MIVKDNVLPVEQPQLKRDIIDQNQIQIKVLNQAQIKEEIKEKIKEEIKEENKALNNIVNILLDEKNLKLFEKFDINESGHIENL